VYEATATWPRRVEGNTGADGAEESSVAFAKTADGRYVAQLSEYDQRIGFDQKWLNRVHQFYKEKQTISAAKAKGYI